eukprot:3721578-Heterocapsa_arctica.AAC.1
MDRLVRNKRIIQKPVSAARRANKYKVNKLECNHLLTGYYDVIRDGHIVGREELSGLKDDNSVVLSRFPAPDNIPRVIMEKRVEVRSITDLASL